MKKFYTAAMHNVVKLLDKEGVSFPVSKKVLLDKAGESRVQIDFNESITLDEYCKGIKLDRFENKAQFFCALIGSNLSL